MRQLGTFGDAKSAQLLADYLLTQRIDTRVNHEAGVWLVWVCNEDRLIEARQIHADFQASPTAERYLQATREAGRLRRDAAAADNAPALRPENDRESLQVPVTILLFVTCAAVAVSTNFGGFGFGASHRLNAEPNPIVQALFIGTYYMATPDGHVTEWLPEIWSGQIWRLLTPIFLHFGAWHFLLNMLALGSLGTSIEKGRGPWIYLFLIVFSAIPSNLAQFFLGHAHWTWAQGFWTVPAPFFGGLSGVLFAMFGYIWIKVWYEPELGFVLSYTSWAWMMTWYIACWTGLLGPVANVAHTFGLLAGMLFAYAPVAWRQLRRWWRLR